MNTTDENSLAHEGEVLRVPQVTVVHARHEDVGEEDTNILVNLEPDRVEQAVTRDQVPVEAPRQETHALIVASTTEDVSDDRAVVVRQTEDGNTGEQGENP